MYYDKFKSSPAKNMKIWTGMNSVKLENDCFERHHTLVRYQTISYLKNIAAWIVVYCMNIKLKTIVINKLNIMKMNDFIKEKTL